MTPIVDGLADEFEGKVTVYKLDAADPANVQLQSEYGLRGHPSFVVMSGNGIVLQTFTGPQPEETLRQVMAVAAP